MPISTYDTDFYTWTQQQAVVLRDKEWVALDVEEVCWPGQEIDHG
jgi:hypothetical protein